jgi:hypothetical protein
MTITVICVSTIMFACLVARTRRGKDAPGRDGILRKALRFIGGPFPLSVALHAFLLLFLVITMRESRARDLTITTLEAGSGGGGGDELRYLESRYSADAGNRTHRVSTARRI